MNERPQLSPDLRPLRYCPNCGQRVAQQAQACFLCGYELQARQRRRLSLPLADLLLVVVVVGVAYLAWTRGGRPTVPSGSQQEAAAPAQTTMPTAPGAAENGVGTRTPLPAATPTPTVTVTPTPIVYTVVAGDTVERIAVRYGVDVEDLMIYNGLTSDLIRVDQELVIPPQPVPRGPDGEPLPTATPTPESAIYLVVVRAGDTIDNIARRLGSSVEAIVSANEDIQNADTIIRPGDQLVVPVGTVVPTATPVFQLSPTATPVPTFTPTPGPRWPAPRLLSPADTTVHNETGFVVLQWLSVGTLNPDEVYVVRVAPANLRSQELTAVTAGTSYRVPEDWLQRASRRGENFVWSVQVARDVRSVAGNTSGLWAASPPSPWRRFTWMGGGQ